MSVSIRRARPDDAGFLSVTDLIATRSHVDWGIYDLFFTDSDDARLRFLKTMATTEPRSFGHFSHFFVAEADGTPAAALCGFTEGEVVNETWREARTQILRSLGIGDDEWARAMERAAPVFTCPYEAAPGSWTIEWVGALPEYRRRGLVAALLEAVLDEGRRTGHAEAAVGVLIGNEPAQRAYERAGFVAYEDVCHPEFERAMRAPGMRKLRRSL